MACCLFQSGLFLFVLVFVVVPVSVVDCTIRCCLFQRLLFVVVVGVVGVSAEFCLHGTGGLPPGLPGPHVWFPVTRRERTAGPGKHGRGWEDRLG